MTESSIYQDIFSEGKAAGEAKGKTQGKAEGKLEMLLKFGSKKLGKPTQIQLATLNQITDVDQIDRMADLVDEVANWGKLIKMSKTLAPSMV